MKTLLTSNFKQTVFLLIINLTIGTSSCFANSITFDKTVTNPAYWYRYTVYWSYSCSPMDYTNTSSDVEHLTCKSHFYFPDGTDSFKDPMPSYVESSQGNLDHIYSVQPGSTYSYRGDSTGGFMHLNSMLMDDPDWYLYTRVCASTVIVSGDNWNSYRSVTKIITETCGTPPPPDNAVICTATSFTIDHGDVGPSTFNGNEKSGTGNITCTGGDASVKLYFSSPVINFSNGGKSNLTFSNGSSSVIINAAKNVTTPFTVKSRLSSSGVVKTGAFSGSSTIITDIQ
ncbi:hypothetical protein TB147_17360 [Klebsiella aerogenes]|uniref:MrpH family fimbial adhesin n=1 Tax=Klebsiella aerogenes TaxID=548 RepID=UPI002E32E9C2|nr:hypothetical protein [Klebsiella aerogenes]MED7793081.1 hypothetical protein [Klebsiella aerogenes]